MVKEVPPNWSASQWKASLAQDVVLYGFGRIGRLMARLLIEKTAGGDAMRLRADEPEMQAMLKRYLSKIEVPEGARVLEIGCGAGPATRVIAGLAGVAHVTGIDPSPVFLESAKVASEGIPNISYAEGDARSLASTTAQRNSGARCRRHAPARR